MSVDRLGRGLEALIRPAEERKKVAKTKKSKKTPGANKISINQIKPNPNQPRQYFDDAALDDLANSIKQKGFITPITVCSIGAGYQLVAGERRWRAAKKLRKRTIPAYIVTIKNDAEMMEMALVENIQRQDLNPLEESEAYAILSSKYGFSHDKIAESIGRKRVTITNSLRLLKLPPEIRKSIRTGQISGGHGRAILQAKTTNMMVKVWHQIIANSLSVRSAEVLVKSFSKPKKIKKKIKIDQNLIAIENLFIEKFGTKVKVKPAAKGGLIQINYYSKDDLDRIIEIIESFT